MPICRTSLTGRLTACFAGLMMAANANGSLAQTTSEDLKIKKANEAELQQIQSRLEQARARQKALRDEIAALNQDIGSINRVLITTTTRSQQLEGEVSEAEDELAVALQNQNVIATKLAKKRALLGEVLAALQRMGRKPPPALLVKPEDALSAVRSSILLGSVVPEMRSETKILLADLDRLKIASREVETRKLELAGKLDGLSEDESRLTMLISEKKALTEQSREELQKQQQQAEQLALKATSLQDLIDLLESRIEVATRSAEAARLADEKRARLEAERLAQAREIIKSGPDVQGDPSRLEPAIAFSKARGKLLLPVYGVKIYDYGSKLTKKSGGAFFGGTHSKNIALQTRPNARVRAPADSWVVYAGPFRSYGHLLILNAGEGYHMVLSGLSEVNVEPGRFVLAGEPVGRMGIQRVSSALGTNSGSNSPVLYVEFRKDGKSIDPSPWWDQRTTSLRQAGDG